MLFFSLTLRTIEDFENSISQSVGVMPQSVVLPTNYLDPNPTDNGIRLLVSSVCMDENITGSLASFMRPFRTINSTHPLFFACIWTKNNTEHLGGNILEQIRAQKSVHPCHNCIYGLATLPSLWQGRGEDGRQGK